MGRRCAHWGGLAALGTVAAWTPVLAQQAAPGGQGGALAGDVRQLTVTTQVETTYDTNVPRTNAAGAALRHLAPEDVYVQPTVALDALLPVGRESLFLTGSVGYDFYDRDTVLNRERINLTGGGTVNLSRCQSQVTGSYARAQSQLEELLPGPNTQIATAQNTATRAGVILAFSCPNAQGLSPTLSVAHSTNDNSNQAFKTTNNSSTSAEGGLSYARPGFGALQTYGSFTTVAYDSPFLVPFPPFELKNNYDLYAGGVRYSRPIGARLSGTVSLAYTALRPQLALERGFNGLTYSAELSYQMSSRLGFHALVSRATLPTNQVGATYLIADTRELDATYKIGARLKLTLGGADNPSNYQGGLVGQVSTLVSNQSIQRVYTSLDFALNRRLSAVLSATDERRNSNVGLFNYADNRVSLTLKGVF